MVAEGSMKVLEGANKGVIIVAVTFCDGLFCVEILSIFWVITILSSLIDGLINLFIV